MSQTFRNSASFGKLDATVGRQLAKRARSDVTIDGTEIVRVDEEVEWSIRLVASSCQRWDETLRLAHERQENPREPWGNVIWTSAS